MNASSDPMCTEPHEKGGEEGDEQVSRMARRSVEFAPSFLSRVLIAIIRPPLFFGTFPGSCFSYTIFNNDTVAEDTITNGMNRLVANRRLLASGKGKNIIFAIRQGTEARSNSCAPCEDEMHNLRHAQ